MELLSDTRKENVEILYFKELETSPEAWKPFTEAQKQQFLKKKFQPTINLIFGLLEPASGSGLVSGISLRKLLLTTFFSQCTVLCIS
jgi:hypothetical protein